MNSHRHKYLFIMLDLYPATFVVEVGKGSNSRYMLDRINTLYNRQSPMRFMWEPYSPAYEAMKYADPRIQFSEKVVPLHRVYNYLFDPSYMWDLRYLTK